MYTSAIEKRLKTGMIYLAASAVIAAAAAVYGLFSHGVYSYWMTYAFMVPLLLGAAPHFIAALRDAEGKAPDKAQEIMELFEGDLQTAVIVTLTAGSLLKGALDIYGTSNRLLYAYPAAAVLVIAAVLAKRAKSQRGRDADQYAGGDPAEH